MSAGFMKLGDVVKAQKNVVQQLDANIKHIGNAIAALMSEQAVLQATLEENAGLLAKQRGALDEQTALRNSLRETLENFNA